MAASDNFKGAEGEVADRGKDSEKEGDNVKKALTQVISKGKSIMEAIGFPPEQLEFIYEYAIGLYKAGQHKDASLLFYFLHEINPRDPRFPFSMASCAYKQGRIEEAAQYYSLSALLDQENPSAWFNIGDCHFQLNALESAIVALERAIDVAGVDPNFTKIKEEAMKLRDVAVHHIEAEEKAFQ